MFLENILISFTLYKMWKSIIIWSRTWMIHTSLNFFNDPFIFLYIFYLSIQMYNLIVSLQSFEFKSFWFLSLYSIWCVTIPSFHRTHSHQHWGWILWTTPTNHLNNPSSQCNLRLLRMICTCMCIWVCY